MTTSIQSGSAAKLSNLKATLLVSGTCIGGGMLAIPIQTAELGFFLSALVLIASWGFMTFTGLLLVEATLWLKANSHFSSLAQFLLGRMGKLVSLAVYLFMNSVSLVAYTSGGAILIDSWMKNLLGISPGYAVCCAIFTVLFGGLIYCGVSFVGRMNNWFSFLMGIFFVYLMGLAISHLQPSYLVFRPVWKEVLPAFPLILASFSYQMVIPSVCSYLNYEVGPLKKAVWVGSSIPFAIYLLWILVIHGLIPLEGTGGLREAVLNSTMIVAPLKMHLSSPFLSYAVDGFAFFALATSYLGLSMALFDFISDLFRGAGIVPHKNKITFLSLGPCLLLAIFFPRALLDFLDLSGGFGDALLSGLIPVAMVWTGRYWKRLSSEYTVPGGKWTLSLAGIFFLTIFIVQWLKLIT